MNVSGISAAHTYVRCLQDVGWSGLQEEQVDGRAARYGQTREVHCYHLFARGTTDMIMDANAREKHIFLAGLTNEKIITGSFNFSPSSGHLIYYLS